MNALSTFADWFFFCLLSVGMFFGGTAYLIDALTRRKKFNRGDDDPNRGTPDAEGME